MVQVLEEERNKQGCQASQQTKYVICFKKEYHSCCFIITIVFLRYVQLSVFPKTVLCSVLWGMKGREKLSFVRGAP